MLPVVDKKYIMTEFDGCTKKEVVYKGSRRSFSGENHKIYVIEDDDEYEVNTDMLILMKLEECE